MFLWSFGIFYVFKLFYSSNNFLSDLSVCSLESVLFNQCWLNWCWTSICFKIKKNRFIKIALKNQKMCTEWCFRWWLPILEIVSCSFIFILFVVPVCFLGSGQLFPFYFFSINLNLFPFLFRCLLFTYLIFFKIKKSKN